MGLSKKEKAYALGAFADAVAIKAVGAEDIFAVMSYLRCRDEKKGIKREDVDYLHGILRKALGMMDSYGKVLIALGRFKNGG